MNRIDAGIVCETLFGQDVERPESRLGDRPARCTVSAHRDAGRVFNRLLGLPRILAELISRKAIHGAVPIAVAGKLMPTPLDLAHQVRKPRSYPSDKEKRCFRAVLVKEIKHALRVRYHARRPAVPAFAVNRPC